MRIGNNDTEVTARILALVQAILQQNAIATDVQPASNLADSGLTSMDMVNLMLGVEAEFDLTIPQDDITPENFHSVETIQRMILNQARDVRAA